MTGSNRIGLFGGTFNPVHVGHRAIAESFLRTALFEELWILVTPDPPHKANDSASLAPFEDRLAMTTLAFADTAQVVVSDLENTLDSPHYTLKTIHAVRRMHPEARLFYCMGEDSWEAFSGWYKPQEILDEVTLVVAGRPPLGMREWSDSIASNPMHAQGLRAKILEKTVFADHVPVDISSTRIRNILARDEGEGLEHCLHPDVLTYIHNHGLYRDETI